MPDAVAGEVVSDGVAVDIVGAGEVVGVGDEAVGGAVPPVEHVAAAEVPDQHA